MERSAELSSCRTYRYNLWRRWGPGEYAMFIGLNPSTADETQDDPTIRRCIGFSQAWGFKALCMTNLFAYRATNPQDMIKKSKEGADIIGPENTRHLVELAKEAGVVVAAWGTNGGLLGQDRVVRSIIPGLCYLFMTKSGFPGHPLYLPSKLTPRLW